MSLHYEISVIMATYNGEKYLAEQLDSILAQSVRPVEIIVCDDRSTDGTINILEKYKDKGVKYYINETRLGVVQNFKRAASLTKKDTLIAFADQDDIWLPEKLEVLLTALNADTEQDKPALVFSDLMMVDKDGTVFSDSAWRDFSIDPHKQTFRTLLTRNIATGCTMLINAKMKEEFLKMPHEAYMHDAWITFVAYAFENFAYVKRQLIYHRNHDSNVLHHEGENIRKGLLGKMLEYTTGFIYNKQFFEKELKMAKAFFDMYKEILSAENIKRFEDFFKVNNKGYIAQKRHIRYINKIEYPDFNTGL